MKQFSISFWLWFPAVFRAGLQALAGMIAAFIGNLARSIPKTEIEWIIVFLTVALAGLTVIIAFLDQTMALIKSKAGDTQLFFRETPPPIQ